MIDTLPKLLELFLVEVFVKVILFDLCLLSVINHTSENRLIKDCLNKSMNALCHRRYFRRHCGKRSHFKIHTVFIRNLSIHIHVLIGDKIELNGIRRLAINSSRLATDFNELALEVFARCSGRSVVKHLLNI